MDLNLDLKIEKITPLEKTLGIPCSEELRADVVKLKRLCGKNVNEKIREFLQRLVDENREILKKAS